VFCSLRGAVKLPVEDGTRSDGLGRYVAPGVYLKFVQYLTTVTAADLWRNIEFQKHKHANLLFVSFKL
jgi:hypothetical protein